MFLPPPCDYVTCFMAYVQIVQMEMWFEPTDMMAVRQALMDTDKRKKMRKIPDKALLEGGGGV